MKSITDVQNTPDIRNLAIDRVGIKDFKLPIAIESSSGIQHSIANISAYTYLGPEFKGTHMSRFIALLTENTIPISPNMIKKLTMDLCEKLNTSEAQIIVDTILFRMKTAPISMVQGFVDYKVRYEGEFKNNSYNQNITVTTPVTTLCPCSKEISQYGAHNQRSHITIQAYFDGVIYPEELFDIAEKNASCEIYSILKRPDEKYVTEKAYEQAKFVEDVVRDITQTLKSDSRITQFTVESENFESIHNHSAYAKITYPS